MKGVSKPFITLVMSLFMFAFVAPTAFAKSVWKDEKNAVEKGGWYVTYGNKLNEADVLQGSVEPGISIYLGQHPGERNREAVQAWAESLIRKSIVRMETGLGSAAVRDFGLEEQKKARRLTVRSVKKLLRKQQAGVSNILTRGTVEFKAGVSKYIKNKKQWKQGIQTSVTTVTFVPYVALRQKPVAPPVTQILPPPQYDQYPVPHQDTAPSVPVQNPTRQIPPPPYPATPAEVLNAFSLTNTARQLKNDKSRWEWTARIKGPAHFLRRISSVTYFLHPSFSPNVYQGDSAQPGHPFTAVGWGVFELKAEVVLKGGARQTYRHMLRFN